MISANLASRPLDPTNQPTSEISSDPQPKAAVTISANVCELIGRIVDRAKLDRKGVFWSVGAGYRQANPAQFENTLGFGTPGIVLTLLEYYRQTRNSEIAELIHKAGAWVAHRTQTAPFQHGYYGGTAGVWQVIDELEKDFPGSFPNWKAQAMKSLAECQRGDHQAGLASGVAGTLLGAWEIQGADQLPDADVGKLTADLLAAAKPCRDGLYWDFNPTSIRAPAGFLQGNAGVDYSLAGLFRQHGIAFPTVLAGSLGYADSLFDQAKANWLDQDAAGRFRQMQTEDVQKMMAKDAAEKFAKSIRPEDSLAWATGTAGILISRSGLAAAYQGQPVGTTALTHCIHAVGRIGRATEAELDQLDGTLMYGLPGLILAMESVKPFLPAEIFASLAPVLLVANPRLAEVKAWADGDDYSLLSGMAGLAYAHLRISSGNPEANVIAPRGCFAPRATPPTLTCGDLSPLLERRLPAAASLPAVRSAVMNAPVSLSTISAAAAGLDPTDTLARSIKHDTSLYEALADTRFQELFWRELTKRYLFAQRYGEGMDDNLLFERFVLSEGVTLFELDFDPYTRTPQPDGQKLPVLRQITSNGVAEVKLSSLQHALVTAFRSPAITLDVIRTVIRRVETPNVTQRQLADLSRKMIRAFVQAGYLVADSPGKIEAWLLRKRLQETRKSLFPATGRH